MIESDSDKLSSEYLMEEGEEIEEIYACDYFAGGVPPGDYFCLKIEELHKWVEPLEVLDGFISQPIEVCFIGAVAYFEAFFKDHFGAIINICPDLIQNLKEKDKNVTVQATDILYLELDLSFRIGSLISENFDFGSPKKTNSNFSALLNLTPFSATEKSKYDEILHERNLLVHHGGIYTIRYCNNRFKNTDNSNRVFLDSVLITKDRLIEIIAFMGEIAEKTCSSSITKLNEYVHMNNIELTAAQAQAINLLSAKMNLGTES